MGIKEVNNFDAWKGGKRKAYYISLLPDEIREEANILLEVDMWTLEPKVNKCTAEKKSEILSYLQEFVLARQ
jgi:hypothetical protein